MNTVFVFSLSSLCPLLNKSAGINSMVCTRIYFRKLIIKQHNSSLYAFITVFVSYSLNHVVNFKLCFRSFKFRIKRKLDSFSEIKLTDLYAYASYRASIGMSAFKKLFGCSENVVGSICCIAQFFLCRCLIINILFYSLSVLYCILLRFP